MKIQSVFFKYFNIILFSWVILVILRLSEIALIFLKYGTLNAFFFSEIVGLGLDILWVNVLLLLGFPLFWILNKVAYVAANSIFALIILAFSTLHLLLIGYFVHQLKPLDVFLFQYTLDEVYMTVKTSGVNLLNNTLLLLAFLLSSTGFFVWLTKRRFSNFTVRISFVFILFSLLITLVLRFLTYESDVFTQNKSVSFYTNTIKYFYVAKTYDQQAYSWRDAKEFQEIHGMKNYIDFDFPLLRSFESNNVLKPFFHDFDTTPNIVILLIEGLNDDFIHEYKGVELMPFLSNLKRKSLYWDRCFALSERSFGAIPSIIGSLPYAEKGFSGVRTYPRHFSLVSLLNVNNYFTSFYYGQAGWFNKKDRFFEYNNIDNVLDNSGFDDKYQKIIEEDYFWGYNDKDLFQQALEIIKPRSQKPHFDIYFTGTSHSPYRIAEPEKYEVKFQDLLKKLEDKTAIKFFQTYKQYILTLLFVDDALEVFINDQIMSDDFKNTLFIITGDHPMTEIPIKNSLKRYHVPLLLYSDKLIKAERFSAKTSHLDIYETLLSFLADYGLETPKYTAALGGTLPKNSETKGKKLAFMNDNREIIDYLSDNYYLAGNDLFEVGEDLSLTKTDDKITLQKLKNERINFIKTSKYASLEDRILPDTVYHNGLKHHLYFTKDYADSISFSSEYYNFMPVLEVKNNKIYYDIDFDYTVEDGARVLLVFQLTALNDSVLLWQTREIDPSQKSFSRQLILRKNTLADSLLQFKSFVWNRSQSEFKMNNLNVSLWGK